MKRKPRKLTSQVLDQIESLLEEDDDLTAGKIQLPLHLRHNTVIGLQMVRKTVRKLGWKYGKTRENPSGA